MATTTTVFLPYGAPIVTKSGFATQSMQAWMRLITPQAADGAAGITALTGDVTATGPGSAVATLSNTAVTPGTYGDATHVGQFTVNGKGRLTFAQNVLINGANVFKGAEVTITDAQFKTLPTTPVSVIPAPGAGVRIPWFLLDLDANFAAGAYTNVNADGFAFAEWSGGDAASNYIANDSGIPLTFLTTFTGATTHNTLLQLYTFAKQTNDWGNLPIITTSAHLNEGIQLTADNNGAGNFTGGNAANTLKVTPYWITVTP